MGDRAKLPVIPVESIDVFTWCDTTDLPSGEFLAVAAVPCPAGRVARGGVGGQMITACVFCGHMSSSTTGERHDDPMFVPIVAEACEVAGRSAVQYRLAYAKDFAGDSTPQLPKRPRNGAVLVCGCWTSQVMPGQRAGRGVVECPSHGDQIIEKCNVDEPDKKVSDPPVGVEAHRDGI